METVLCGETPSSIPALRAGDPLLDVRRDHRNLPSPIHLGCFTVGRGRRCNVQFCGQISAGSREELEEEGRGREEGERERQGWGTRTDRGIVRRNRGTAQSTHIGLWLNPP